MKKIKKIMLILLAICVSAISLVGCAGEKKGTLDDGVLKVGYTIYRPMNYFDDENNFVGFDTELAKAVGEILKVTIEFVEIDWDNKVMSLNSGEIDAVWNGMTITDNLKNVMSITDSYLENKQVIICKKADENRFLTKQSVLTATEVLVEAGSAGEEVALNEGADVVTCEAQRDTLMEVLTGTNKIAIIDSTMANAVIGEGTNFSDLVAVDVGFETEEFGIGFRKSDSETMQKVNDSINLLKDDGTFDRLYRKYFA